MGRRRAIRRAPSIRGADKYANSVLFVDRNTLVAYIASGMQIFRTKPFAKAVKKLGMTEEEVRAVEEEIAADHTAGDVIVGTSGARKIRFAMRGKGKRGGGRAIYVVVVKEDVTYMITAYSKATQDDLTNDDKKAIKAFVDSL